MIGLQKRKLRAIVIGRPEDMRVAMEIANLASNHDENSLLESVTEITVEYRNEDTIKTKDVEDLFSMQNKKANPIVSITFRSGTYTRQSVKMRFGGGWSDEKGAEIEVEGDPEFCDLVIKRFNSQFNVESGISDLLPSIRPSVAGMSISISLAALIGLNGWKRLAELSGIFSTAWLFSVLLASGFLILSLPISILQSKIFGRFVCGWGDGIERYNSRSTVLNWLF